MLDVCKVLILFVGVTAEVKAGETAFEQRQQSQSDTCAAGFVS